MELIIGLIIGAFVGWFIPEPQFVKDLIAKFVKKAEGE